MQQETSIELINKLANSRSLTGGTSLITMYIPSEYPMNLVTTQLNNELATSKNIKSKQVKLSVQSALRSAQQQLKLLNTIPQNGIVLCAGEIQSCL